MLKKLNEKVFYRSEAFLGVQKYHSIRATILHDNGYEVWSTVWSQERKQSPQLSFPNKFEHEEEDVGNISRIVEQQEDRNRHYSDLSGWPL